MSLINKKLLQDTTTKDIHNLATDVTKLELKILFQDTINRIELGQFKKEESEKVPFLQEMFELLGYRLHENLEFEFSTPQGRSIDAVLGFQIENKRVVEVVIEWKGIDTKNLDKGKAGETPVSQMSDYMSQTNAEFGIIGNFLELRLYSKQKGQTAYHLFNLKEIVENPKKLDEFIYVLKNTTLLKINQTKSKLSELIEKSDTEQEQITKRFYNDYKQRRLNLFQHLVQNNPEVNKHILVEKSQKILDRLIFVMFCEDGFLLPTCIFKDTYNLGKNSRSRSETKIWEQIQYLFEDIDKGRYDVKPQINAFNGGLFAEDIELNSLIIKDSIWQDLIKLAEYDFESDLNVNILGHIFEQSISDIEEIKNEIEGETTDKKKSKRKKDGIYYTPEYITDYIVSETVGSWLADQENVEVTSMSPLDNIKILDPAGGSGAFPNQVHNYLIKKHIEIANQKATESGLGTFATIDHTQIDKSILKNNIFMVDLQPESVEIAKLSLWLKTAKKDQKLNNLDENIKCGNSLIDDIEISGDMAFDWKKEFPQIFENYPFPNDSNTNLSSENSPFLKGWQTQSDGVFFQFPKLQLPYNSKLKENAKELRQSGNLSEVILWENLKRGHLKGYDFTRQQIIGNYIVDFYCPKLRLVIEIDGESHDFKGEYDQEREKYLTGLGLCLIHFSDVAIKKSLPEVLESIYSGVDKLIKENAPSGLQPATPLEKGNIGFDVIVGNPPYVLMQPSNTDGKNLNYFKQNYEVASYKIDLFHLFIEKGIRLLNDGGYLGFITPNTYLTNKYIVKLRQFILDNCEIKQIVLFDEAIFPDASVDTSILIIKNTKQKNPENEVEILKMAIGGETTFLRKIKQKNWEEDQDKTFNVNDKKEFNLTNCVELGSIGKITFGLQTISKDEFVKLEKVSDEWENCYTGKDISRYHLDKSSLYFKNNFAEVKAGGSWDMEIHHSKKIVVRQVGNPEPIFAYDNFGFASLNTMYNIVVKDKNFVEKYVLGVLSSNFIKEFWLENFSDNKQLFPKIKGYQLQQLPIPKATPAEQTQIAELVDQIMALKSEIQDYIKNTFILLQAELGGQKINLNKKLEKFWKLDFGEFLAELTKQKIQISHIQKRNLIVSFETDKNKVLDLEKEVERVDVEIEGLVKRLYGILHFNNQDKK